MWAHHSYITSWHWGWLSKPFSHWTMGSIIIKHRTHEINRGIFEAFFKSQTLHCNFFRETHQGSCPLPAALDDIIAPRAAWLGRGWKDRGKGPAVRSAASHATLAPVTAGHMPPCATKPCHSSLPLDKQRPLSGQSLLWSCRAEAICSSWLLTVKWPSLFLATFFYWFVQRSTSQADLTAFWIFCLVLSVLKRSRRLSWAIPSSVCGKASVF